MRNSRVPRTLSWGTPHTIVFSLEKKYHLYIVHTNKIFIVFDIFNRNRSGSIYFCIFFLSFRFRSGGYNTLVATCVGEEGLDIGEVDLIVLFDVSKSPIR